MSEQKEKPWLCVACTYFEEKSEGSKEGKCLSQLSDIKNTTKDEGCIYYDPESQETQLYYYTMSLE